MFRKHSPFISPLRDATASAGRLIIERQRFRRSIVHAQLVPNICTRVDACIPRKNKRNSARGIKGRGERKGGRKNVQQRLSRRLVEQYIYSGEDLLFRERDVTPLVNILRNACAYLSSTFSSKRLRYIFRNTYRLFDNFDKDSSDLYQLSEATRSN